MRNGTRWVLSLATLLFMGGVFAGEAWRWKENGKWVYGDHYPRSAENPERVSGLTNVLPKAAPDSFLNEQARKLFPVVVYGVDCPACDQAKKLLESRRIPVTYKDAKKPEIYDEFKKYSPESQAPVVLIGDKALIGFEATALNGALDDAGYEKTVVTPGSAIPINAAPGAVPPSK